MITAVTMAVIRCRGGSSPCSDRGAHLVVMAALIALMMAALLVASMAALMTITMSVIVQTMALLKSPVLRQAFNGLCPCLKGCAFQSIGLASILAGCRCCVCPSSDMSRLPSS